MPITYTSRNGKTYYLHTGPKRGGGTQHFVSTKPDGTLAQRLPEGFEIYETVNGQVYLRRQQPKLIHDDERDCISRQLAQPRAVHRYQVEVSDRTLTIHESAAKFDWLEKFAPHLSQQERDAAAERFAHYQPVLRLILSDAERRLFAPERYCFRGAVDDWIPIGPAARIDKLASKYLKHLGKDSMYELF